MHSAEEMHEDVFDGIPDGVPVVMLNLMKFRARSADGDGSGWDAYLRYSKMTSPLIKAEGGAIIWAGEARGTVFGDDAAGEWDYVALVSYPSKAAFRAMITSDVYQAGNKHRVAGCEQHTIIATEQKYGRFRTE